MLEADYSILLIDDDEHYARLAARMLEDRHRVTIAHNCARARELVEAMHFDCAVVDYMLPDGGGKAFIRELVTRELPVIVLTGHDEEELGINTVQLGAQDYLTKNDLTPKLLRRAVHYAVERAQSRLRMLEAEHERKELEKQFHQSQKMEAIGRLAGGVAHDFNNLLTAIIGFSRFVLDELAPGDHRREDLIHVLKAADRAETLTRQLLAFSRKQTIEPRILDLNELVTNVEKLVRRTIGEHIDIRLSLEDALWSVRVDAAQFEQVLMNMAVNARDAMRDGGTLRIATKNDPEKNQVLVLIEDNGSGMPPEVQAQIFEPFFTTKDRNSGTGLGLATCYGIIKQSGGEIDVDSTVGKGTRFTIGLPRERGQAQPLTELRPEQQESADGNNARILVIEDDERVRALTVRMLRKHGFSTIEASTTREGRDVFDIEEGKIDLVVSDIVMPDGRGPDLALQLSARDPNMRFLLMTGYDDDSLDQKLLAQLPHYELLRKPFIESALLRAVRELLSRPMTVSLPEKPVSDDATRKPRILLVDDDAGTRRTYQRLLSDEFDLRVLDDSLEDVLETLRRDSFDIIFFDVMMPRVSGFDLAEKARSVAPENAERIVHLTGMQDDTLVNAYATQTKQCIVSKPLTVEKLKDLLSGERPQRMASA